MIKIRTVENSREQILGIPIYKHHVSEFLHIIVQDEEIQHRTQARIQLINILQARPENFFLPLSSNQDLRQLRIVWAKL